ncbi:MAG: ATP-binding protein [Candidatus Poribacteria bacterium]|nr:ATP-binding protein [Candidatus Poribacteria bacterium]
MDGWHFLIGLIGISGIALGVVGTLLWQRGRSKSAVRRDGESVSNIARGLAHEIRNPLNTISITLQLLEEDMALGTPVSTDELRDQLSRVRREIDRLERILADFQRYARLMQARPEPTDLARLVTDVLEFVQPEADRAGVELIRHIGATPLTQADPALLRQAFLNLALNAFQAMEDGGTLTVTVESDATRIEVTFEDTGLGVPDNARDRLFEPFFSTKKGGTGLGLAVVKQVAEAHGGDVSLDSETGRGARFTVHLPITQNGRPVQHPTREDS